MATIAPLFENSDIRTYQGRYTVQLEIPASSTLTSREIDKIGYISCWDQDPNEAAEGYEGLRSVLISRENPIQKKGKSLEALQISGIGSFEPKFDGLLIGDSEGRFCPPSKRNFIRMVPGTLMSTSCANEGRLSRTRPDYRAFGTYLPDELMTKIVNTNTAAGFNLEHMLAPHVEAYGRFLDDELRNDAGNFGFIVFPVPSVAKERMATDFVAIFRHFLEEGERNGGADLSSATMGFYYIGGTYFGSIVRGARELHDRERQAHLQLHLSNAYLIGSPPHVVPYVMDWATMTKLGDNRQNNIVNRTVDLLKPSESFIKLLTKYFGSHFNPIQMQLASVLMQELSMEIYSNTQQEVNNLAEYAFTARDLGRVPDDVEVVMQWMKNQGIEGFPRKAEQTLAAGVDFGAGLGLNLGLNQEKQPGRNDPCPCHSGLKYKRCCGGK